MPEQRYTVITGLKSLSSGGYEVWDRETKDRVAGPYRTMGEAMLEARKMNEAPASHDEGFRALTEEE